MSLKTRLREVHEKLRARGVLPSGLTPPVLIVQFVGTRFDAQGQVAGPNLDFRRAEVGDRIFWRGEAETLAAFEARVKAEIPPAIWSVVTASWSATTIAFFSDDDGTSQECKTRTNDTAADSKHASSS